jgi:ATP-dependent Clp protease ATP-binding subunit ClpB
MNINKFTIKSQEAIQHSQQLAEGFGQQQIENEHLFNPCLRWTKMWLPFILKLNVNVPLFIQILDSTIQSFPKVTGGEVMFLERQILP